MARFRCTVCSWKYEEATEKKKFKSLPDSYACPVCGTPKSAFIREGVVKGDESIETTVADKIVEQLEAFGVKYIYGIPGDSNLPLIDAIWTFNAATQTWQEIGPTDYFELGRGYWIHSKVAKTWDVPL